MNSTQKDPDITAELLQHVKSLRCIADNLSKLLGRFIPYNRHDHTVCKLLCEASSNIIMFPCLENKNLIPKQEDPSGIVLAPPGVPLPHGVIDYRPLLARNGLILLSWDKRSTEMGDRYTAYWVTSSSVMRYYASKSLPLEDFPLSRPDHKSYAAQDGIEFYGQEAPLFIVQVAPELMMSNPKHKELRDEHIEILKREGSTLDFKYRYLLKTDKEA